MPPNGMATWVVFSPLKVRCGARSKRSFASYEADSAAGAPVPGAFCCAFAVDVAAASAADDPATRNSLRVDFFRKDMVHPLLGYGIRAASREKQECHGMNQGLILK
jgi:hypothetical protein